MRLQARVITRIAGLAIAACLALPAFAQPSPPASRIPTVTRLVKVFSELEAALFAQAHSTDPTALDQSLDPSFEMRTGTAPGTPVPRDEWIRQARAAPGLPPRIEQMAVHDFGGVAVVSFRAASPDPGAPRTTRARFIVDCWKHEGDGWKLAVRYASDAAPEGATQRKSPGTIEKRY